MMPEIDDEGKPRRKDDLSMNMRHDGSVFIRDLEQPRFA